MICFGSGLSLTQVRVQDTHFPPFSFLKHFCVSFRPISFLSVTNISQDWLNLFPFPFQVMLILISFSFRNHDRVCFLLLLFSLKELYSLRTEGKIVHI